MVEGSPAADKSGMEAPQKELRDPTYATTLVSKMRHLYRKRKLTERKKKKIKSDIQEEERDGTMTIWTASHILYLKKSTIKSESMGLNKEIYRAQIYKFNIPNI